jgi:Tol biopolymer transport system component
MNPSSRQPKLTSASRHWPAIATLALGLAACGGGSAASAASADATATSTAAIPTGSPATTVPTPSPSPTITGLTGRIVFTRAGGAHGDETAFVINADGSDERQLGPGGHVCCPWVSPDGSRVTFTVWDDVGIETVISDLDGENEVVVEAPDDLNLGSGPISPDGSRIVPEGFTSTMAFAETYIASTDGSAVEVLVKDHFIPGDFSPDGGQVLLFRTAASPQPGSLWLVDVDGSNLRQLTPDTRPVQCCFNYRWSPDGTSILFASPDGALWTIAPDSSEITEIFREEGNWAITPTWSPDGSLIMFGLDPSPDPFAHPDNGLYVIRADGSDLTLFLGGADFKREPVWVP